MRGDEGAGVELFFDIEVDEDQRGVFRCERLPWARWIGHEIMLR